MYDWIAWQNKQQGEVIDTLGNNIQVLSSTGKTANIQLNQWNSSDKSIMDDFNDDNKKIDDAIGSINAQLTNGGKIAKKFKLKSEKLHIFLKQAHVRVL